MAYDKELTEIHWDEMRKLFHEQVKDIEDKEPEKAHENFKRLAAEEREWLKTHPNCARYFAPINTEVNPPSYIFPDADKVPCRDCIYVGKGGPTNAFCQVYRKPHLKPDNVLWGKKPSCEYQITHKEAEKAKVEKEKKHGKKTE